MGASVQHRCRGVSQGNETHGNRGSEATIATKELDRAYFDRAIELAADADRRGNLPIGAVVSLGNEIIAEGRNAIWSPSYRPNRHAELEALRLVPEDLWDRAGEMTLYTTLEPCLMCAGAILLHRVGRLAYGADDPVGGSGPALEKLPPFFDTALASTAWDGPLDPVRCQPLQERAIDLLREHGELGGSQPD